MATIYVDPSATGLADGTSWENAFTTLQAGSGAAVSGDSVLCRGTEVLSAPFAPAKGAAVMSPIFIIGCNASGVVDGTRYTLDANNVVANCLKPAACHNTIFYNLELKNATGDGIGSGTDANTCSFINFSIHNNGGHGAYLYDFPYSSLIYSDVFSNGGYGVYSSYLFSRVLYSTIRLNTNSGIYHYSNSGYSGLYYGNLVFRNSSGFSIRYGGADIISNTITNNTYHGITLDSSNVSRGVNILANRITFNLSYGIRVEEGVGNNFTGLYGLNLITGNGSGGILGAESNELYLGGLSTNQFDGVAGYVDPNTDNYNLTADAAMRRVALQMPGSA